MLTVKHIEPDGYELLQPVERVWRAPFPGLNTGHLVFAKVPGEEKPLRFRNGRVIVLNEGGLAIASYLVDDRQLPEQ